jgi:hypothetical protein
VVAEALVRGPRKLGNVKTVHGHVFIQMSNGNKNGKRGRMLFPWRQSNRDRYGESRPITRLEPGTQYHLNTPKEALK